ncbi:hypothetical protein ACFQ6N_26850 [Kitasatospora sp. NPDC056446]|uniref:hypothetical protein n=1 Tax=Kitasatospora sp. NPDC056446 TaxID=3345819 RepID=UPI00369981B0
MDMGDTNDAVNGTAADTGSGTGTGAGSGTGSGKGSANGADGADGPRELSRGAAIAATVLATLCGAAVLLAVFHWLGWTVPGVGWIVAKAGIKLAVGGFAGLAVGLAWLRARLRARPRADRS